jgi:hypothetical protein
VSCYSASPDGARHLPVEHSLSDSDSGTTLNIDSVLSVFKNGTELLIVIESLQSEECRFTASTNISYESTFEDHSVSLTIRAGKSDITLVWALHLEKIVDDGFATAVVLTLLHPGLDSIL